MREHLTDVYGQSEDEIYRVGAPLPLPRTSAEALTQGKPLTSEQGHPVSKALCGALRQRHPSPYLSGAVQSKTLVKSKFSALHPNVDNPKDATLEMLDMKLTDLLKPYGEEVSDVVSLTAAKLVEGMRIALQGLNLACKRQQNAWRASLSNDASIQELLKAAKDTIGNLDADAVEKNIEYLKEAWDSPKAMWDRAGR